jgi:molybdenum-dependent DNA-binding transcriptional regulator ModE
MSELKKMEKRIKILELNIVMLKKNLKEIIAVQHDTIKTLELIADAIERASKQEEMNYWIIWDYLTKSQKPFLAMKMKVFWTNLNF